MAFVDYYKILGVDKDIPQKDVRAAYRKRAKQFHPDLHPNDPKAKAKFQALNEAYEVLSDPDKRAKYDQYGENWKNAGGFGAGGFGGGAGGAGGAVWPADRCGGGGGAALLRLSPVRRADGIREKGSPAASCAVGLHIYASRSVSRVLYLTVIYLSASLPVRFSHLGSGRAALLLP